MAKKITKKSTQTIEEFLKEFDEIISNISIDKQLPKTETPTRKVAIKKIQEEFTKENLVFVLGAGVSVPFGVPTWDSLLQRLMVFTIEKEARASNVLAKLFNGVFSPNPIIAGRYLQSYFQENNDSFEKAVRQVLYSSVDKATRSELMDEIVSFCVAPGKSPNLNSILTYNFDDILESAIKKLRIDVPHKSIFGVGMDIKKGELPIYHIHGYLPEKGKLTSQNNITLGEYIYHKQYSDVYSWNNIVQINKFIENTCIFIGSSLTDPNIRRLLDISYTQKGKKKPSHYIFKKRKGIHEIENKLNGLLKESKLLDDKNRANLNFSETVKILTDIYERFEENDSASFGVQTIWIDSYEEIHQILKEIRENIA
jgi:hypothetical protein